MFSHAELFQGSPLAAEAALIPFGIMLSGTGGRERIHKPTPAIVAAAATPGRGTGLRARVRFPSTVGPAASHPLKAYFSATFPKFFEGMIAADLLSVFNARIHMLQELEDPTRSSAFFAQHTVSHPNFVTHSLVHACDCLLGAVYSGHVFAMTSGPLPGTWVELLRAPVEDRVDGRDRTPSPKRVLLPVAKHEEILKALTGKVTDPEEMVEQLALLVIEEAVGGGAEPESWVVLPFPASFETGTVHSPTPGGNGFTQFYMHPDDVRNMRLVIQDLFDPTDMLSLPHTTRNGEGTFATEPMDHFVGARLAHFLDTCVSSQCVTPIYVLKSGTLVTALWLAARKAARARMCSKSWLN